MGLYSLFSLIHISGNPKFQKWFEIHQLNLFWSRNLQCENLSNAFSFVDTPQRMKMMPFSPKSIWDLGDVFENLFARFVTHCSVALHSATCLHAVVIAEVLPQDAKLSHSLLECVTTGISWEINPCLLLSTWKDRLTTLQFISLKVLQPAGVHIRFPLVQKAPFSQLS